MSAASHGAGGGVVIGIVTVLLLQQFSYLVFSQLVPTVIDLLIGAIVGGLIFGLVGWGLGVRYRHQHPSGGMPEWKPS
jgi:hypothetical protein